jgi:hypothetical protein
MASQCQDHIYRAVKQCLDENHSSYIKALHNEVGQLRDMVVNLASRVSELNSQLSAYVSYSAPHIQSAQPDSLPPAISSTLPSINATATAAPTIVNTNRDDSTSSVNISRQRPPTAPNQQRHDDAVTAMYLDQKRKQLRACNIIISGLPNSDNDLKTATELLRSEFEWDFSDYPGVTVTSCRRIGRCQENKIQPLLVTLADSRQSDYFIRNAKYLRGSSDDTVQSSVFINADLTLSEARAAYELRLLRRQRQQQSDQHPGKQQANSTNSRIIFRSNNYKLSASSTCPAASTHTTDTITSQPTQLPVIPSRLVWSVPQPMTAVSSINPAVPTGEINLASVNPSHTKIQVDDSSTIIAGSSP